VIVFFYLPATSLAMQAAAAATQKALLKDGKDKGLSAKDLRQLRRNGPPIIRKPKSGRNEEEGASSGHSDSNHLPHHSNANARSSSSGSSWESKDNTSSGGREKKRKAPEGVEEVKGVEAVAVSTGMFHNDSRSSTSIRDIDRSMQGENTPFSRTATSSSVSASASASKKQRQRR
jgi:hypothetical protein